VAEQRNTATELEVLRSGATTSARTTATELEVLRSGPNANIRTTSNVLEVLRSVPFNVNFGSQGWVSVM
jgi:hypothetical protein